MSIIIVISVCIFRKLITGNNDVTKLPNDVYSWLATLTITTTPVSSVPNINWVYWSLSYEVFFYLVIGICIFQKSKMYLIISVLTILSVVPEISQTYNLLFFLNQWGLFSLGIGLKMLSTSNEKYKSWFLICISLISVILNSSFQVQIVALITIFSIWLSDKGNPFLLRTNYLTNIGKISYSLYLLHVPIGCYLLLQYRQGVWLKFLPLHIAYDFGVLFFCVGLSILFFYLVEQPSLQIDQRNYSIQKSIEEK